MIKEKIWKIFAAIGGVVSAVFYVLFQQKKDEEQREKLEQLHKEAEQLKVDAEEVRLQSEALLDAINANNEERKKNEEKISTSKCPNLDGYNVSISILSEQQKRS